MQGHPCWGYSHAKHRVFYCQKSGEGDMQCVKCTVSACTALVG